MSADAAEPGLRARACRVCGNAAGNRVHRVHEMMFGLGDPFDYLECGACGCLQLCEIPANLDRYYPPEYHSLLEVDVVQDNPIVAWLKRRRASHLLHGSDVLGKLVAARFGIPEYYAWLQKCRVRLDYSILDVGSGMGRLLCALRREGFRDLTGADPFIAEDTTYANGVRLLKRELEQVKGSYDWIYLHHSFEHMPDPQAVLHQLYRLLKPDRFVFMRIPVGNCHAWKEYGEHWVQLDAPRHFFLHTEKSVRMLAEAAGFRLEAVDYDSTDFQFWMSEQYARDIHLGGFTNVLFNETQLAEFRTRAEELNRRGEGDQACFYLYKPG